jgi:hypothetical protein
MQCAMKAAVVTAVDAPHCADAGTSPRRADHGGVGRACGHVAVGVAVQACSTGCQERLAGGADRTEFQVACPAGWWTGDRTWESGGQR